MQPVGIWKSLSTDSISVTLKFGFQQTRLEYKIADTSNTIVSQLYYDAEHWLYELARNLRVGRLNDCYTMHLFRIPSTEVTLVPVLQPSDIEQNSIIEIVLVPVEINQNPHSLYQCQLNLPTNCSKCTRFITGLYKQGFRCRKCRMTYHKDCAPLLLDDCPVQRDAETSGGRKHSASTASQLMIINPFAADITPYSDRTNGSQTLYIPVYSTSRTTTNENAEAITPNTIIEKGIFPACIHGSLFYRRYLFRLTTNVLSVTTNLSQASHAQTHLSQLGEGETVFPLMDIEDLVFTQNMDDRDSVFEIHLRNKTVINVGKKTDPEISQIDAAQFCFTVRDQQQTLINANTAPATPPATSSSSHSSSQSDRTTTTTSTITEVPVKEDSKVLARKKSTFKISPVEKDGEHKDLYQLYEFTGEKIGEGI